VDRFPNNVCGAVTGPTPAFLKSAESPGPPEHDAEGFPVSANADDIVSQSVDCIAESEAVTIAIAGYAANNATNGAANTTDRTANSTASTTDGSSHAARIAAAVTACGILACEFCRAVAIAI